MHALDNLLPQYLKKITKTPKSCVLSDSISHRLTAGLY